MSADSSLEGTDVYDVTDGGIFNQKTGEKLYTLEEASQVLRDQVCARDGHKYNVIVNAANNPVQFTCSICARSGTINWETP